MSVFHDAYPSWSQRFIHGSGGSSGAPGGVAFGGGGAGGPAGEVPTWPEEGGSAAVSSVESAAAFVLELLLDAFSLATLAAALAASLSAIFETRRGRGGGGRGASLASCATHEGIQGKADQTGTPDHTRSSMRRGREAEKRAPSGVRHNSQGTAASMGAARVFSNFPYLTSNKTRKKKPDQVVRFEK